MSFKLKFVPNATYGLKMKLRQKKHKFLQERARHYRRILWIKRWFVDLTLETESQTGPGVKVFAEQLFTPEQVENSIKAFKELMGKNPQFITYPVTPSYSGRMDKPDYFFETPGELKLQRAGVLRGAMPLSKEDYYYIELGKVRQRRDLTLVIGKPVVYDRNDSPLFDAWGRLLWGDPMKDNHETKA